jgi:glycosyltransferase involved in cell wall biosynthesis
VIISPRPPTSAPWLTVIMPTHRGEQWIDASLRSLAAEAAEGVEVLVIDSSPTPATLDIARGYSVRLHLRAVERRDLLMWHAKSNFGVEIAESNHICLLHQDDLWFPGRAAAVRAWIEFAPKAPLHLAPSAIMDRSGRTLGVWRCPLPTNGVLPSVLVMERLLVQNFVAAPSPVFRKDAWLACGGLDEKLWYIADWDIWLKLAASGPVYYHDGVTTGFRIHGGSLTVAGSRDVADFAQQMQIVLDRHLARFCDRSKSVDLAGRASIAVNSALAAASAGDLRGLLPAVSKVLRLGPAGIRRYLRDSRIVDRVALRMRAKLGGAF